MAEEVSARHADGCVFELKFHRLRGARLRRGKRVGLLPGHQAILDYRRCMNLAEAGPMEYSH